MVLLPLYRAFPRRALQHLQYASRVAVRPASGGGGGNANLTVALRLDEEPDATALILDGGRELSYGALMEGVGRVMGELSEKYKLQKGDRLLSRVDKSVDSLFLYLAALRLGVVYVPLNPAYTDEETAHFVQDAEPRLFVSAQHDKDAHAFASAVPHVVDAAGLARVARERRVAVREAEQVTEGETACICYTSGTTGRPKGAMLTHGGLAATTRALVDAWRFTPTDRLLHQLPFYHVHGMFLSLNCALASHSAVIWREKFTVEETIEWLPKSTVMSGVPTFYSRLLASPLLTRSLLPRSFRLFVSGSAPLSLNVWEAWKERTGHTILERYGMTEAMVICSNLYEESGRVPGSVGLPLPGVELNEGAPLAVGRDRMPVCQPLQWLLPAAREDQGGVHRRRLLHHGRRREGGRARFLLDPRPQQGPRHLGRLEYLSEGGGGCHRQAGGSARVGSHWLAPRRLWRGRRCGGRTTREEESRGRGREERRRENHRGSPRETCQLQGPKTSPLCVFSPAQLNGKSAEEGATQGVREIIPVNFNMVLN